LGCALRIEVGIVYETNSDLTGGRARLSLDRNPLHNAVA
jgi:hypothetical protein